MSIAQRLVNLADGLSADGVLSAAKGGTGGTTGGGTTSPTVSQINYLGNDTAASPAGGTTITLTGTNFASGAKVLINNTQVSVVTVVSSTQITFSAPALAAGSYILYVVNLDGSTAIAVPGIQYSGVPAWSTAAGSLGTSYETGAVSATLSAVSDSAVTYSVFSGTLPSGATLNSNGTISGTSPLVSGSTTYTFTVRATDAENQDTDREFSLTVNPDVVSWSSPVNNATLSGTPNTAYSSALTATSAAGSSISYTADSLPAGLSISGSTITGTPTAAGTSTTTLTATAATTSKTAQITINWTINVAADAYFKYTTLLLNAETTATPFIADASANNFALTAFGDTKPSNFNPYTPGYYSNYFDGNGDSLTTSTTALNTSDFTIEFWMNAANTSDRYLVLIGTDWGESTGVSLIQFGGNFALTSGTANYNYMGSLPPANTWAHIAVVRSGVNTKVYVNGVSSTAGIGSSVTNLTATQVRVCHGAAGSWPNYEGYISNLRIVKGTALYTANFTPPTEPLTSITGTILLTCQGNRFIDTSTNAATVTPNNDTKISSFDPFVPNTSYATYGSAYFDGSGDYLSVDPVGGGDLGTTDFTIEYWMNASQAGSFIGPVGTQESAGSGTAGMWRCLNRFNNANGIYFAYTNGSMFTDITFTTTNYNDGAWHHVAYVRSSGMLRAYVDGVQVGSAVSVNQNLTSGKKLTIGYNPQDNAYYTGYTSNLRIVKGTALYTSNFAPPTVPLTAVSGTSLLTFQTNQPYNNHTFLDNSSNALAITRQGNTTQGSFSPYGANWSNYFDGSGDYLALPAGNAIAGTGDFTVELWVYHTAANAWAGYYYQGEGGSGGGINFRKNDSNQLSLSHDSVIDVITSSTTVPINQWAHVAVTRSSGTVRLFINGAIVGTTSYTGNFTGSSGQQTIGSITSGVFFHAGYISNFRVVKGTAVYTAAFTPSTVPLTAIAGTEILTCQSATFIDNSIKANTVTKGGDVSVQKFSPFATVTQAPISHSTYFGGQVYGALSPASTSFNLTGDFTLEAWVNPSSFPGGDWGILDARTAGASAVPWIFGISGAGKSYFYDGSAKTGSVTVATNAWSHVAWVRTGSVLRSYVNGVLDYYNGSYGTGAISPGSTSPYIGTKDYGISGAWGTTGYISNLRIVNGTGVYTTTATNVGTTVFTPPTTALTAVTNTVLLACQSATLRDNSTNNFTITPSGTVAARQQNPFGWSTTTPEYSAQTYGASAYFDGANDYLQFNSATAFPIGTGSFTAEAWVYTTASGIWQGIVSTVGTDNTGVNFNISNANKIRLSIGNGGAGTDLDSSDTLTTNTWYHVAGTRTTSGTMSLYINGKLQGTASNTANINTTQCVVGRGYFNIEGNYLKGYISDARIVKGQVLYSGSFVPPQAPLTAVQGTALLMNMDRAAISDKSGKVVAETFGDTKLSTAVKKYGSASMYFDGSGDYLTFATNPQYAFGTGDFTIECWVNSADVSSSQKGFLQTSDTVGGLSTGYTTGITFLFGARQNGASAASQNGGVLANIAGTYIGSSTSVITANTWTHLALVRASGTVTLYVNGTAVGSGSAPGNCSGNNLVVGGYYSTGYLYNGYLDDLRITKGYARYTANFTPPTEALLTK